MSDAAPRRRGRSLLAPGARPAWVEIDLAAVRHNAALLRAAAAPASLCAVVKADAYGHGAVPVARAALEGGATWLGVAMAEEGAALRQAGIDAPVLVLSEPPLDAMDEVVALRLTPTLYSLGAVHAAAQASARAGVSTGVHVKVDTGMHRVGAAPADVAEIAGAVAATPALALAGLWTHFPVADCAEPDDRAFTESQLAAFDDVRRSLGSLGRRVPLVHAANSAAALAYPAARLDMVRCGIALYGVSPFTGDPSRWADAVAATGADRLRPVLSWRAQVTHVRRLASCARPSYGRLRPLAQESTVATVPVGYADGVPRRYFDRGGTVLIGERPHPLAGMVTMDQIVVDCGPGQDVAVGDDVVLIGTQGTQTLAVSEWADVLGTLAHEVLCGIGPRVPRVVVEEENER